MGLEKRWCATKACPAEHNRYWGTWARCSSAEGNGQQAQHIPLGVARTIFSWPLLVGCRNVSVTSFLLFICVLKDIHHLPTQIGTAINLLNQEESWELIYCRRQEKETELFLSSSKWPQNSTQQITTHPVCLTLCWLCTPQPHSNRPMTNLVADTACWEQLTYNSVQCCSTAPNRTICRSI